MSKIIEATLVRRFTAGNPAFKEEYFLIPEEEDSPYLRREICRYDVGDNRGNMRVFFEEAIPESLEDYTREDLSEAVRLEVWDSLHGKKARILRS